MPIFHLLPKALALSLIDSYVTNIVFSICHYIYSYYWEKDGVKLESERDGVFALGDGTFEILEASAADSGDYQCFAQNKYGKTMSQKVTIKAAGKINN